MPLPLVPPQRRPPSRADWESDEYLQSLRAVSADDRVVLDGPCLAEYTRGGLCVLTLTSEQLHARAVDAALRRFRLLQYLRAGHVPVGLARQQGWRTEPL